MILRFYSRVRRQKFLLGNFPDSVFKNFLWKIFPTPFSKISFGKFSRLRFQKFLLENFPDFVFKNFFWKIFPAPFSKISFGKFSRLRFQKLRFQKLRFQKFPWRNFLHGICVLKKNAGFAYSPPIVRVMASIASPMISCWSCRSMR